MLYGAQNICRLFIAVAGEVNQYVSNYIACGILSQMLVEGSAKVTETGKTLENA